MKFLKSFVIFSVFLVLTRVPAALSAEVIERILAVVNDEVVTEQDLEVAMAPVVAQYRTRYTGKEFDEKVRELSRDFLNKVIEDKVVLSEAKHRQVIVKDEEVDEVMADVRAKFPSREVFLKAIGEQGLTEKKLWNRFRDQLMGQKLVGYEVKSRVSVSPGEVNEYYKAHPDEFAQGDRVKLRHILIRADARFEDEAKSLAESLVAEIRGGRPFEDLAKSTSEASEAKDGGDMGWMEKGQLMGEIDEKVFALEPGQITDPIKSSLGYHIFKVVERQKFSVKPLSEVRGEVQDKLFKEKLGVRLDAWMKNLKKNAYISIR
ncbi:MAG: peptidylprolyl isomerase [Candidatus Omnitrophica bacterium]|nr:peptidylprolyl isomerase [Candidatus Omnitrophota bacterium]